jgi:carboxymethylenebutenolidase
MLLVSIVVVLSTGCGSSKPPPADGPSERPLPVQESVAYLKDNPNVHGYLSFPNAAGKYPAILVIHDRMGLNDAVKDAAFLLAKNGYVALAVDLYRGEKVKSDEDARRLQQELPKQRALSDLKAAVDYLIDRADVNAEIVQRNTEGLAIRQWIAVGAVGFGMGGGYAMDAALADERLRSLALCYSPLPTEAKSLTPLKASIFYIRAGKDKGVSQDTLIHFCEAMQQAKKRIERIREFGDCSYGFLDPAFGPIYGTPAKKDVDETWELIVRYLDNEFS